jgi:hypothetical protein
VAREVIKQELSLHCAIEWIVVVDQAAEFRAWLTEAKLDLPETKVLNQPSHLATIGYKRHDALVHATGEFVAWFDDDDWHCEEYLKEALHELKGLPPGLGLFLPGAFYVELETGKGEILHTHVGKPMPVSYVGPTRLALEPFRTPDRRFIVEAMTGEDSIWFNCLPRDRYAISPTRDYRWAALAHPGSATAAQKRSWRYTLSPEHVARFLGEDWTEAQVAIRTLRSRLGMRSVPDGQ